jgi:2,3-bisphosphoglycerate-dependent phosphoglycerate mutase
MSYPSPPPKARFSITLLRHGESTGNARGIYQGQAEFDLSEVGRQQVNALAARWLEEKRPYDAVISSPLRRACQTAEIVASALAIPVEHDEIWMERHNGVLAGLHHLEAAERFPQPGFMSPYDPIGQTGESQWDLYLRAGQAVRGLVRRPPGSYLVVSHGGILNMALYAVLGIVPQANFQGARFRFLNAAFAVLEYDPAVHSWLLERLNDRSHWTDPAPEAGEAE